MTGRELIRLQATLHGLPRRRGASAAATRCSSGSGSIGAADRRVGTYSGGMRRRLDLASALVHEPRVLFLDEPTTGLDPVSRKAIWEEVAALNDEGTTVFLTTQYLEEADQLADRVGIIDGGRIVAEGTPASLKAEVGKPAPRARARRRRGRARRARSAPRFGKPLPREGRHGSWSSSSGGAAEVAPVVRALDEAGIAVESLELVEPTLDDVFVAKTGDHLEGDDDAASRGGRRPSVSALGDQRRAWSRALGRALGQPDLPPPAADRADPRLPHPAAGDPDRRRRPRGRPARASPRSTASSTSCSPGR